MGMLSQPEFEQEVNAGRFRPAYLLLGPEEFLRRLAMNLLKRTVISPGAFDFNYSEFSLRTTSLTEVLQSAQTFPFASPRRLVIARELEALPAESQEEMILYLGKAFEKSVLVLDAAELDRRTVFYRAIRERACVVEFPSLKGVSLERWVEQFIHKQGLRISSAAVKKLVSLAGPDLQSLTREIEKLELYVGEKKAITESALEDLVDASRQHGIFELTGAIGRQDRRAALALLGNLTDSGEPALAIVAMVARHFRQLLIAKELMRDGKPAADIAAAAQIPPYFLEDLLRQARAFNWEAARKIYARLAVIDNRIKSARVDPRAMLEMLICSS